MTDDQDGAHRSAAQHVDLVAPRRGQTATDDHQPETIELLDDPSIPEPEDRFLAADVYRSIAALTPDFRDAVVAVDVVGLSYREAAVALHLREATIATRLRRGRQRIARALSDAFPGPPAGSKTA